MAAAARALLLLSIAAAGAHAVLLGEGARAADHHVNVYNESQIKCGDTYCGDTNKEHTICMKTLPVDYCGKVGLKGDLACESVQSKPWCVSPGSFSLYIAKQEVPVQKKPEIECNALPAGLFSAGMDVWKTWFPPPKGPIMQAEEQELKGLAELGAQCDTPLGAATFKKDYCVLAKSALKEYDEMKEANSPWAETGCFISGAASARRTRLASVRSHVAQEKNMYDESLSPCGNVTGENCSSAGLQRAICLSEMPTGYCTAVGLADGECPKAEGKPWCVTPGSFSLYAIKHGAPEVDCNAIPASIFSIDVEAWKEWKPPGATEPFKEQDLSGLEALYTKCNTPLGKDTFKVAFCEFAVTALGEYDEQRGKQEPFTDCDEGSGSATSAAGAAGQRRQARTAAQSMRRGLRRLARYLFSNLR